MANSQQHTGSAVGTFVIHTLLWPLIAAVLVILAAIGKVALEKGSGEALALLNLRTFVPTILALYPYALVPAAVIGLGLAVFAFNSGAVSRKQATLAATIVSLAAVVGVLMYNRQLVPVDLVKDPIESGVYVVVGAILATLLIRGLLRLVGVIAR
jgi:integral membrane sensor domain MASE1